MIFINSFKYVSKKSRWCYFLKAICVVPKPTQRKIILNIFFKMIFNDFLKMIVLEPPHFTSHMDRFSQMQIWRGGGGVDLKFQIMIMPGWL